ncbi:hypothetical protein EFA69_16280 [Rufibacter immobilis]|uniref:Phage tail tape measure protein n=1 Tax=Rufibacter immobilis TaxID=1348778 RepID=A0A3M9MR38_9BACT|nr:hypothetical protein [Rufibacter immobilis]RNI27675.1 hypothetical protein EFA69_16280 [Rufibacter immobilis]
MSVRQDKVQVAVEVDGSQGINELGKLEMKQKDLLKTLGGLKNGTKAYIESFKQLEEVNDLVDKQREKLGLTGMTMKQLRKYLGELNREQATGATFGTERWDELQQKIDAVTNEIQRQDQVKKGIAPFVSTKDLADLDKLEKAQTRLTQQMRGLQENSRKYQEAYKDLEEVNATIAAHREELGITGMTLGQLKSWYKDLETQIEGMDYGSEAWVQAKDKMQAVDGAIQNQTKKIKGLGGMWQWLKSEVAQMGMLAAVFMGLQLAAEKVSQVISSNAELSDSYADIEKSTNMATDEVERFDKALKKIDTRTKAKDLRDITVIGGQLGVANDELLSFVENVDKAVVALGDEFTGGAEEVARELGALQKLFKETAKLDAGEAINNIGSAINALGADGAATGPVIADFTKRLGALGNLGPNISQTLGLGAALQELGLTAEVSSGGVTNVILTMNKQADSFAKFMKMGIAEYKEMMQNNPNEMLLTMAERFKGASSTSIVQTLEKLNINSQEAVKVVALLSNQTQIVREKQELANQAMKEGTSLTDEFNKKNNNFAGKLEKLGKLLHTSFVNSPIKRGMESVVDTLLGIAKGAENATEAFGKWEKQSEFVEKLQGGFSDLLKEYESLQGKTTRTAEENERLETVISKIAEVVPQAVTAWDKYGNAMTINTQKARDFIKEQQDALKYINKEKIEVIEKERAQKSLDLTIARAQLDSGKKSKMISQNTSWGTTSIQEVKIPMTAAEFNQVRADINALQSELNGMDANLALLRGEKTKAQIALEKENAKKDNDPVTKVTELDFEDAEAKAKEEEKARHKQEAAQKKAADAKRRAAEKLAEERQRQLKEMQEIERQYMDAYIANIADEYEREREMSRQNFIRQMDESKAQGTARIELEKLLRQKMNAEIAAVDAKEALKKKETEKELFDKRARDAMAGANLNVIEKGMELDFGPQDEKSQKEAREAYNKARIESIELERDLKLEELEITKGTEAEKNLVIAESEDAVAKIRAEYREDEKQAMVDAANNFADIMTNMINALSSFAQAATEADLRRVQKQKESALQSLDDQYGKGTLRKAKYEKEKEKIEKQAEERLRKIKNEQAKKDREAQIANTIIAGSVAVLSASANPLGILSPQAVSTAIAAGLQLATVIAQPIQEYAEGGLVQFSPKQAKSIAAGGMQTGGAFLASMNEEGQEYVVPNYLLQNPEVADYVSIIEAMRTGNHYGRGYAEGGPGPGNGSDTQLQRPQTVTENPESRQLMEQTLQQILYRLENPLPVEGVWDWDYYQRSKAEIEQIKSESIVTAA